ncbi:hypothetical protein GIB67_008639 [Kingdonia uniflora]|uniref:DUF676 domain-containing protein n=1 Tax=Kingdonia uniflora TaxID=39325 RepID=A0A7J7M573_9MAGN|nr:hypothetical protein GIB67_008639 [Kingdonia uniflora]
MLFENENRWRRMLLQSVFNKNCRREKQINNQSIMMEEESVFCESVNGGEDLWSSNNNTSANHLVIMVNGILGSSSDWKFAAEQFVRMLPDKVIVHCSLRNASMRTFDGVDVMGDRLAEEIIEEIKRLPEVRKISFVAHSVGGLVARYAIGRLYIPPNLVVSTDASNEDSRGTICGKEAMNFITVATPHLGSRGNKQVPFLLGVPFIEKLAYNVIHLIFGRTGRHLFLNDDADKGEPPLLRRMVDDYRDLHFMSALRTFRRRVTYSNVAFDIFSLIKCYKDIVGWRTASIRRDSELPQLSDSLNEKYPHIVYEERCKENDDGKCSPIAIAVKYDCSEILEEELLTSLSRLSWEKVDVSFQNSKKRFSAHTVIQDCVAMLLSSVLDPSPKSLEISGFL